MNDQKIKTPKVSIIISAYNQPYYLGLALDSIFAQTFKDFEIIVVDDGSGPEVRAALEPYMSRIRYFYQTNQGPTRAENFGISQARGEYIASLDHDDIWLPGFLERQADILDARPELAFVCCAAYVIDKDGKVIKTYENGKYFRCTFNDLFRENFIIHSSTVIRKECLDDVGVFDEDFYTNHDHELWLRLAKKYPFHYHPDLLVQYRLHDSNVTKRLDPWLKDSLLIYRKKAIIAGTGFLQRQRGLSKTWYKFGKMYSEAAQFEKAAACFFRSVLNFPLIGIFYWPRLSEKLRFSLPYRVIHVYLLIIINLHKARRQRL
jgi:glycosyltransferase involved in cell wall biosynthesis